MNKKPKHKIAFVMATKDRPQEIRRALRSIEEGTLLPAEVIVVDGGATTVESVRSEFPRLNISYVSCFPPSAARQRNLGIRSTSPSVTLIGFFDDDIVLEPDALEKMMNFWEGDQGRTGGAAFNMRNHPLLEAAPLKAMPLTERIGLYSSGPGRVMPSGFQTMIGSVKRTTPVQWLSTGASTFRRVIFNEFEFDQWFEGYSYLEDLDFSYRVGKKYRLAVVADAGFYHFPGPTGRGSGVEFGRREVLNRAHFVKKNRELSLPRCYLALTIRSLLSFSQAVRSFRGYAWQRVWGNLLGFASLIKR